MNQTDRTFILTGLVVSILMAMHLLPNLFIGDTELRHVNILCDVMPETYQLRDAIDVIPTPQPPKQFVAHKSNNKDKDQNRVESNQPVKNESLTGDSIKLLTAKEESTKTAKDSIIQTTRLDGVTMIADYSEGAPGGMGHFYEQLGSASKRLVRIAYYGDSFIEGDILTADLREMLQNRFGGSGVGWIHCTDPLGGFRRTVKMKSVGLKEYEVVKKPYSHQAEGIAQRYYVPQENSRTWASGSKAKQNLEQWHQTSLYLRSEKGLNVTTYANSDTIGTKHIGGSSQVQLLAHQQNNMTAVGFQFTGVTSPTYIYGMALESNNGVILDNFSMRGSAGNTISKIPLQTLNDFARLRNYDLIVLHFGLNVANEKSHASAYKAYIKKMQEAIEHLQQAYPHASILVVSMPDRDQRTAAGVRTMKGVESLVAYQQIMAGNCHVAYFNLFEAMGGRESMKSLVDKGMANKDYTHLTFSGGRKLAQLIYDGLMAGYETYQH
jgi:lysophospholipase L1-like esterase